MRHRLAATALTLLSLTAVPTASRALFHDAVIDEVLTSYKGNAKDQFLEIRMLAASQTFVANSVLAAFDSTGTYIGDLLVVPNDLANSGKDVRWLVGTAALQTDTGVVPDFLMPDGILPTGGGMVCFGGGGDILPENPPSWDRTAFSKYVDCVAYGTYSGPTNVKIGTPTTLNADGHSLQRTGNTMSNAADFACADPATPENNSSDTVTLPATAPCVVAPTSTPIASTPTQLAITPSVTPSTAATCAPTATPYCSDLCPIPPTAAPGCIPGGGPCIQNPQCGADEVRVPLGNQCSSCATVTPTHEPATATVAVETPTPVTTAMSPPLCVGDCDGSASVAVNELIVLVNIALGNTDSSTCSAGIPAGAPVDITLIIRAVNDALNGCGPTASGSATPTTTPASPGAFVDNGDGTISDMQTGLIWEKKDQSGGLHDVDAIFPWTGVCTDQDGVPCRGVIGCTFCQPDAAAESTCNAETGGAVGCARCPGAAICQPINGLTTVWQWLNQINGASFAGHNDWRIPTIGRDGGAVQLETIVDANVAGCGTGAPCVASAFNTSCAEGCAASACSCADIGQYWSATTIAEVIPLPSVWSVLFFRGTIGGADKTSGFFARAVRSPPCGTFLATFGSQGGGDGQFFDPEAIAVDGNGNVFVADSDNHRIEKFTPAGGFVLQWGSMGEAPGQFHTPDGLALDAEGNIYVADLNNNRIEKFDNDGTFITTWGEAGSGEGQLSGPVGVAVDAQGNVLVADRFNNRVQKFTGSGSFVTQWGGFGQGDGQFSNPVGVAVDSNMNVYVADFFNDRIQKFTGTGMFLGKWGSTGSGDAQFIGARAVAVAAGGTILAIDGGNDRVEAFTDSGAFLTAWGSPGNQPGQLNSATALAVAPNGSVWITDENPRVQRFACSVPPVQ